MITVSGAMMLLLMTLATNIVSKNQMNLQGPIMFIKTYRIFLMTGRTTPHPEENFFQLPGVRLGEKICFIHKALTHVHTLVDNKGNKLLITQL